MAVDRDSFSFFCQYKNIQPTIQFLNNVKYSQVLLNTRTSTLINPRATNLFCTVRFDLSEITVKVLRIFSFYCKGLSLLKKIHLTFFCVCEETTTKQIRLDP